MEIGIQSAILIWKTIRGSSGDFSVEFHLPSGLKINSNLNLKQARFSENGAVIFFSGQKEKTASILYW